MTLYIAQTMNATALKISDWELRKSIDREAVYYCAIPDMGALNAENRDSSWAHNPCEF